MNFWYDVENATALTEYIGYYSPVVGVREQILEDAETARAEGDDEWADTLEVIAETSYPTDEQLEQIYIYKILDEDEERQWNDMFNEVVTASGLMTRALMVTLAARAGAVPVPAARRAVADRLLRRADAGDVRRSACRRARSRPATR